MESYDFILSVAIILASTKLLGIATKRIALPQVVGALFAGLILGPACLGLLHETEFLNQLSELGVIVLMFTAGLETDVHELRKSGGPAFLIALIGVLVPLAGGTALSALFHPDESLIQDVFLGIILTATSVSITVETLREIGRLSTRSGSAILGAALIDDVLGIIALTLITSMADPSVNIGLVLVKIAAFFVFSAVGGWLIHRLILHLTDSAPRDRRRYAVLSLALCMAFAYIAEVWFGVADITGAYVAGIIVSNTSKSTYIASKCGSLSDMLLSPCFFASIGAKVVLPSMSLPLAVFSLLLILWAVVSKVIGCGLGARLCRYSNRECIQIGVGMISRGEVALIVANKGISSGLMRGTYFAPIIIMVMATTIVTPILLKVVYKGRKDYGDLVQSNLVDRIEDVMDLDLAAQSMLETHDRMREAGRRVQEEGRQPQ